MKKFDNFNSNLAVLSGAHNEDLENEFIISGIIDKFFIQFELAWKVLKELLRYEGNGVANSGSPREIIKAAYAVYEFIDEDIWLSMLKERNNMERRTSGNALAKKASKNCQRIVLLAFGLSMACILHMVHTPVPITPPGFH